MASYIMTALHGCAAVFWVGVLVVLRVGCSG